MSKAFVFLLTLLFVCNYASQAQATRHVIQLRHKGATTHSLASPGNFLTQKAILKRQRYNIPIDSFDIPVPASYLDSIRNAGAVIILNTSRWLNNVCIITSDAAALNAINNFSFVESVAAIAARSLDQTISDKFNQEEQTLNIAPTEIPQNDLANIYNYGQSYPQVHIHQGEFLHNYGFSGQGMQLAVLDAGFRNHETLPTFDSMRINGQLLGNWDFVTNTALAPSSTSTHSHGTHCLSTMAANLPGTFIGTAPKTSYYLFRTEDAATEMPIEEQNIVAALERADSLGVDMASISLGYNTFDSPYPDHSYADMDGNTTIAAIGCDIAAQKGMLVSVAIGNEGNETWQYLLTPADADSVLAVGAVNASGIVGSFSSYGPSSDGRVKPDVAAIGVNAVVANAATGQPALSNGTSFACPNIAGLSSCLWQAFPEINNMGIITALRESATKYTSPDNRVGYGIPDMKKAFVILLNRLYTQQVQQAGCKTQIKWTAKAGDNMHFEVQRKLPTEADFVSLHTIPGTGSFSSKNQTYEDDLSAFTAPINIQYRIKMNMDTDTSFYFPTVTIDHTLPCNNYTFTGNGNWTDPSNWQGNIIPPATLPQGSTIYIDPAASGECILNTTQQIAAGALIEVRAGKKLLVPGNLIIE